MWVGSREVNAHGGRSGTSRCGKRSRASKCVRSLISALEDRGHAHPAGGADGNEAAARTALGELFRERRHYPRPGSGEWMAGSEAAAFEIELRPVDWAERRPAAEARAAGFLRFPGLPGA